MRKIGITFHISKLSVAKFECSACTINLETSEELFFLPSKHLALSVDHLTLRNHLYWYVNEMLNKHKNTAFSQDIA